MLIAINDGVFHSVGKSSLSPIHGARDARRLMSGYEIFVLSLLATAEDKIPRLPMLQSAGEPQFVHLPEWPRSPWIHSRALQLQC